MQKTKSLIYAVGFYQLGTQLYLGVRHYYNSFVDTTSLKQRLSPFKGEKEGHEWAVVTGASDGIGAQYALELAKCGFNIKLVAHQESDLEKVAEQVRAINPAVKAEVVLLDVSKAEPSEYATLFAAKSQRTSVVVNNASSMKLQKFLQLDPALIEYMIKANVHPYVYMTKYALQNFEENQTEHKNHRNLLIQVSSITSYMHLTYFSTYAGTRTFNHVFADTIRQGCKRSSVFGGDQLYVQSLHPSSVVTKPENTPDSSSKDAACSQITTEDCIQGGLADIDSIKASFGAWEHTRMALVAGPFIRLIPQLSKYLGQSNAKPGSIEAPFVNK